MVQLFAGSAGYLQPSPRPALTIGNFDGVHLGHLHLLRRLVETARSLGVPSCVYTFEPAPRIVLAPQQHQPRVLAWPDKLRLLGEAGVDHVIVERFTRAFAQHPPEWFASQVLGRRVAPSALVVGYDFRFGRARQGDLAMLRHTMPGVPIEQVQALELDDEVVSSSAIRSLVAAGAVERAAVLLGRPHFLRGTVVQGDQRGRTIGFPTANLETDSQLNPADGVYAVRASVDGGPPLPGVANLGVRPTVDGKRHLIEIHLLDGDRHELYGHELVVSFVSRLRAEQRFPDLDALVAQIREDAAEARRRLGVAP